MRVNEAEQESKIDQKPHGVREKTQVTRVFSIIIHTSVSLSVICLFFPTASQPYFCICFTFHDFFILIFPAVSVVIRQPLKLHVTSPPLLCLFPHKQQLLLQKNRRIKTHTHFCPTRTIDVSPLFPCQAPTYAHLTF